MNPLIVLTPIGYFIRVKHTPGTNNEQDLCRIGTNDNKYHILLENELASLYGSLEDLEQVLVAFAKRYGLPIYRRGSSTDTHHPHYNARYGYVLNPFGEVQ